MKIGPLEVDGNVFLAPMAGITDPPFRRVVQQFGVSAVWTEMISAPGLVKNPDAFGTMDLNGHVVPTVFQIYGTDPETMAEAARIVVDKGAAGLDINMGCPARKIVFKGAGAALMQDVPLASRIVRAVRRAVPVALTVKIRSGWCADNQNAPEFAQAMEAEGADGVIVHSRSRSVRHSGPVSLDILEAVKNAVRIPVIGNGGITGTQDALDMLRRSGCEGVMVGRGALGRPWMPWTILNALSGTDFPICHCGKCGRLEGPPYKSRTAEGTGEAGVAGGKAGLTNARPAEACPAQTISVHQVIRTHFRYQLERLDALRAVHRMRKHLVWYSGGMPCSTEFRRQVFRVEDPQVVMQLVDQWFADLTVTG